MAARLEQLGADKTAELLRKHLPTKKGTRSGDLGEILATEFVTRKLAYEVPILRLRWKDGRETPLRGDDVVAFRKDENDGLSFLKGEAKSRARLTPDVVRQAADALDQDHGRPGLNSVLFVAERLREQGADEMAVLLENAVLNSFSGCEVEHLLFTFSGNSPNVHLSDHLEALRSGRRRYA
ncbi:MAG: Hachiman antiphage defense system protein HamA, partial [Terriglobia bacterium]